MLIFALQPNAAVVFKYSEISEIMKSVGFDSDSLQHHSCLILNWAESFQRDTVNQSSHLGEQCIK